VSFWVERDSITTGECTVLHWDVEYATAVYLDGEGVPGHGTREICPTTTTTYHLHVVSPAGDVDRYVTVTVKPKPTPTFTPTSTPTHTPTPTVPPDTEPPTITNITESDDPIKEPPCEPNKVTISAKVTDPSGVSKVELTYRVVEGPRQGKWCTLAMSLAAGAADIYQVTVDWDDLKLSLDPPVYSSATIEYYIKAWDTKDNVSKSRTLTITLKACPI
jgi:hypothetical protein